MSGVGEMIKQLSGMVDTDALSDWENLFVSEVMDKTKLGEITGTLPTRESVAIERIWRKHFSLRCSL